MNRRTCAYAWFTADKSSYPSARGLAKRKKNSRRHGWPQYWAHGILSFLKLKEILFCSVHLGVPVKAGPDHGPQPTLQEKLEDLYLAPPAPGPDLGHYILSPAPLEPEPTAKPRPTGHRAAQAFSTFPPACPRTPMALFCDLALAPKETIGPRVAAADFSLRSPQWGHLLRNPWNAEGAQEWAPTQMCAPHFEVLSFLRGHFILSCWVEPLQGPTPAAQVSPSSQLGPRTTTSESQASPQSFGLWVPKPHLCFHISVEMIQRKLLVKRIAIATFNRHPACKLDSGKGRFSVAPNRPPLSPAWIGSRML